MFIITSGAVSCFTAPTFEENLCWVRVRVLISPSNCVPPHAAHSHHCPRPQRGFIQVNTAELCGSSSSVAFQNYKFNFGTEKSEQLLSVFVSGSLVMTVILNTTFVLWLTAQSVHCTLLQPGCTIIFNGLDLHSFLGTKRHSWRRAAAALQDQGVSR